ncbi:hypothetical protein CHCC20335_0340 [Bacillus paralicheniformis]|nr:hypothetical protein CHCC20335_0340 [Bacillus paralicheniformis]
MQGNSMGVVFAPFYNKRKKGEGSNDCIRNKAFIKNVFFG